MLLWRRVNFFTTGHFVKLAIGLVTNLTNNVYLLVWQLPCTAKVQKSYAGYKFFRPARLVQRSLRDLITIQGKPQASLVLKWGEGDLYPAWDFCTFAVHGNCLTNKYTRPSPYCTMVAHPKKVFCWFDRSTRPNHTKFIWPYTKCLEPDLAGTNVATRLIFCIRP